jgi:simple sugar transport system substrate-binding protein
MPARPLHRFLRYGALAVLIVLAGQFVIACDEQKSTTTASSPFSTTASSPTSTTTSTVVVSSTTSTTIAEADEEFVFGMLLVGSRYDNGWSQANYEGGVYVEEHLPGTRMVWEEKANASDRPDKTVRQLAESLVARGAQMIFFTSSDMEDDAVAFAKAHPDIPVVQSAGDSAWKDGKDYRPAANLSNIMGKMEYGNLIAGVAAALTTKTGKIGYLGPVIDDETRRLAASAYLGARYAWTEYLGKDPADLKFSVNWIGFWFNIPGVTSDPAKVTEDFFDNDYDVVISGIDTTEALTEANDSSQNGKGVWAIPYNYVGSLDQAPAVALGVPYFNWGPTYLQAVAAAREGQWSSFWLWQSPDWSDINNPDSSLVGFAKGQGLSADASNQLDEFISALAEGLNLWTGPLNLQDGTAYLAEGQVATDQQIWYLPQLLEGMEGRSIQE